MSALLALLSSVLWGTSDFLGGTAARRLASTVVVGASQAVALVLLIPLVLTVGSRPEHLWAGPLAGLLGLIGLASFYAALAGGTMGVIAPLAASGALVPVVVGLARGDSPSLAQVGGIVISLIGVILASGPELTGGAPIRPLLLGGVAALCFGSVTVFLAYGSKGGVGAVATTLILMRVTSVGMVLLLWSCTRQSTGLVLTDLRVVVPTGLFDVAANGTYALASRGGLLSVTAVLASLYPVMTVILARQLHGERLRPVQVVGVAGTLLGVGLLAAG